MGRDALIYKLVYESRCRMLRSLQQASLLSFLASKQRKTLGGLPKGVKHPAAALLHKYVEEGIPTHTGAPWSTEALENAISKGPHDSACTP